MRVLITGATGFVGKNLATRLFQNGHDLVVISRNPRRATDQLPVPAQIFTTPKEAFAQVADIDAVIHLAGESIVNKRWTPKQKKIIVSSRVDTARELIDAIQAAQTKPKVFISSSAIGIYGNRGDETLDETSSTGSGFLAEVCKEWENVLKQANLGGARKVSIRIGAVLGLDGGIIHKLLPIFKSGLGGAMGSGKQWMSWVHIDDLCEIFIRALNDAALGGPVNAVSPHPVTNADFSKQLAKCVGRGASFATPEKILKLALGEMSSMILESQRVLPKTALLAGYTFKFQKLDEALRDLCKNLRGAGQVFRAQQWIPKPVEEVFLFFSDTKNLERITPPWLNFKVVRVSTSEIMEGTLIDYKLKIRHVPIRWRSKIENWERNRRFVDTQLRGPYKKWHHTHSFTALRGGTMMSDEVLYEVPAGSLISTFFGATIKKDVGEIFQYRAKVIREIYQDVKPDKTAL